jgi:hypothetical protein
MYPGFLLIRYNKTHRHGNTFHEEAVYTQIPRSERLSSPCRGDPGKHQGYSRGRSKGKMAAKAIIMDFTERDR